MLTLLDNIEVTKDMNVAYKTVGKLLSVINFVACAYITHVNCTVLLFSCKYGCCCVPYLFDACGKSTCSIG
jgi:hypothetical protein